MAGRFPLLRLRAGVPEPEPVTEINIIPVIDISLVLLVILFISAPLLSYPNLPIELPRAAVPETREPFVAVSAAKDGSLAVGSQSVEWPGLQAALAGALRKTPDATVVLRVDKAVPYRVVERLLAAAKEAGARRTSLGIEAPR